MALKPAASDCEYDVFVSYAHVDDQPLFGAERGWVTVLVENLKSILARKLGRADDFSLWIDHDLARNKPFGDELRSKVESSATLLLILSPGYLASVWCQEELRRFRKTVAGHGSARVFVVERDRISEEERPEGLEELIGFRFWEEQQGGSTRTFGEPDPSDRQYVDRLLDLGSKMAEEIQNLSPPPSPTEDEQPIVSGDSLPAVFLAEVTDDLINLRRGTESYLRQEGIPIFPKSFYPRDPKAFRAAMQEDLEQCKFFVQLLGPNGGIKAPDLPQGYGGLQYELAQEAGLTLLQWRSPQLEVDDVTDEDHRKLLREVTVLAEEIETFKLTVTENAKRKEKVATPCQGSEAFVFVDVEPSDWELGQEVCNELRRRNLMCALPLTDGTDAEIRADLKGNLLDCDAPIIFYGQTTQAWVRARMRYHKRVMQERRSPPKEQAMFLGPPPADKNPTNPVDFMIPDLRVLDCRNGLNTAELDEFVSSLVGS